MDVPLTYVGVSLSIDSYCLPFAGRFCQVSKELAGFTVWSVITFVYALSIWRRSLGLYILWDVRSRNQGMAPLTARRSKWTPAALPAMQF